MLWSIQLLLDLRRQRCLWNLASNSQLTKRLSLMFSNILLFAVSGANFDSTALCIIIKSEIISKTDSAERLISSICVLILCFRRRRHVLLDFNHASCVLWSEVICCVLQLHLLPFILHLVLFKPLKVRCVVTFVFVHLFLLLI